MGQNNKRPVVGGTMMANPHQMNGHMHQNNISTNSFGVEPHGGPLNLEPNSQSNMIYSSDSGKVTLDDFELLKVIGQGNFAKVMQVRLVLLLLVFVDINNVINYLNTIL